ncbi:MAG: Fe-S cluster assembly protein SufD [Chlamydiae bacterium]|nr:Fe-S cluster assembly protein SufD [Chlamydiota bacterium]
MTVLEQTQLDPFHSCIESIFSEQTPSPFRSKAFGKLFEKGLPTKKFEAFTYFPLRQLYANSYKMPTRQVVPSKEFIERHVLPECKGSCLVFIDGAFVKEMSFVNELPSSVACVPLAQAEKGSYAGFLQKRYHLALEQEKDPFVFMNLALGNSGAFVYIPANITLEKPIQCLHIISEDNVAVFPRVQLVVGSSSKVSWITSYVNVESVQKFFQTSYLDVSVDEDSSFDHVIFNDVPKKAYNLFSLRSTLKKQSRVNCINLSTGSKASRQDYYFAMNGEEGDVKVTGLSWLDTNHHSHAHVIVDHHAPSCVSDQFFKGVLAGSSQTSFIGKIVVRQPAQQTRAYQLNNNLLLSEGTIANSKPGLEILADDVKASHGATVSQLDEEQLFYLRSRGLTADVAKSLLVEGFCRDILDKVSCDSLKKITQDSLEQYLIKQNT